MLALGSSQLGCGRRRGWPQPDPTATSWREWPVSFVLHKGHMGCGRGRAQRKQDLVALVTWGHGGRGSRGDESEELVAGVTWRARDRGAWEEAWPLAQM